MNEGTITALVVAAFVVGLWWGFRGYPMPWRPLRRHHRHSWTTWVTSPGRVYQEKQCHTCRRLKRRWV